MTSASAKRSFTVDKSNGKEVVIEATRVEDENGRLKFYDGDNLIASIVGANGFNPTQPDDKK